MKSPRRPRAPEIAPATVRAFRRSLTDWFAVHRRPLPWRTDRTPYRVWISELMLQQTRVDQVIPYFDRWMARFPDLATLAASSVDDVLKLWEGLGYYSRARRIHATAVLLVRERGAGFPVDLDGLRALPGIGPYTAAAIGSLAFGLDAAVVDGNVIRVLARAFAFRGNTADAAGRERLQAWADALLPAGRAGEFNEAMMELGATVCTPRQPRCADCPLAKVCQAYANGRPEAYPVKAPRKRIPHKHVGAAVIIDAKGRYLIAQRRQEDMLGGLWEFPGGKQEPGETIEACIAREIREELGVAIAVGPHLVTVRHAFSHFTMDLHAHVCRLVSGRPRALQCAAVTWSTRADLEKYAFGRADRRIIAALPDVGNRPA